MWWEESLWFFEYWEQLYLVIYFYSYIKECLKSLNFIKTAVVLGHSLVLKLASSETQEAV